MPYSVLDLKLRITGSGVIINTITYKYTTTYYNNKAIFFPGELPMSVGLEQLWKKANFFSRRANLVVFMALQGLMEQITFIQLRQMDSAALDHNSFFYTPCCLCWPNFFAFFCTTSWFSTYSYFALNCLFHTKTNKTSKAFPKTASVWD